MSVRSGGGIAFLSPLRSFIVHNINFPFPCRADSVTRTTVPVQFFVPGIFSPADGKGGRRLIRADSQEISPAEPLTDRACPGAGHISHSVLDYRRLGGQ